MRGVSGINWGPTLKVANNKKHLVKQSSSGIDRAQLDVQADGQSFTHSVDRQTEEIYLKQKKKKIKKIKKNKKNKKKIKKKIKIARTATGFSYSAHSSHPANPVSQLLTVYGLIILEVVGYQFDLMV